MNARVAVCVVVCILAVGALGGRRAAAVSVPEEFGLNYSNGFDAGFTQGYSNGHASGFQKGKIEGTARGREDGFQVGWSATYGPAYDKAYASHYPAGLDAGYDAGILVGFQEGFAWADAVTAVAAAQDPGASWGGVGGSSGATTVLFGLADNRGSSNGALSAAGAAMAYDWSRHYYDLGFADGNVMGAASGSSAGYDEAFTPAYAAAFGPGVEKGKHHGNYFGMTAGREDGFDAGWDVGFDVGYPYGFELGLEYYATGNEAAWAAAVELMDLVNIPEPGTCGMALLAMTALPWVRRRAGW
jgi:hypothetical protein